MSDPVRTASLDGPIESPIAALGTRIEMSSKPLNLPVVVPKADASGSSKMFGVQQHRSDSYVPGNLHGWISYDIAFEKPLLIRAGGELRAGADAAGPSGLASSQYEKELAGRRAEFQFRGNSRVINAAPYLALIGRVCSSDICSAPFVVGAGTLLCPSPMSMKGELQLWTNNYVRVEGFQTLLPYSRVSGGYRFQTEPAPSGACGAESIGAKGPIRPDIAALEAGQVIKDSAFLVSSRQMSWKPFFVPLDRAIVIRASGYMLSPERVASMQGDLHVSAAAADRIASSAEGLSALVPNERQIVLDELSRQRNLIMDAVSVEREQAVNAIIRAFAAERSELLGNVDLERLATLEWATAERREAIAEVRRALARSMEAVRAERAVVVDDLRRIVDTVLLRVAIFLVAAVVLAPLVAHAYARVWPRRLR